MKRAVTFVAAGLVTACFMAALGWAVFIRTVNSRITRVSVSISGSMDEVSIYNAADPSRAVASIQTNGQDTIQEIGLPTAGGSSWLIQASPAQYYFVSKKDEHLYKSGLICCRVGFRPEHRKLIIRSLSEWEVSTN